MVILTKTKMMRHKQPLVSSSTPTNTSIMYQQCTAQPQYQPQAYKHEFSDLALAPLEFSEIHK